MPLFELPKEDISTLNDGDLRELIGRLCEAELIAQDLSPAQVYWGGAQDAPDGGVDVRVAITNGTIKPGFVPRNWTEFQVKKHKMSRADCMKEMQLKNGHVKPIIAEAAHKGGAYIIASGEDDCTAKMREERLAGMNEAVAALPDKANLHLDLYGRDKIAQWLNCYPAVSLWARERLGKPLSNWKPYGRWAAAPQGQDDSFIKSDEPCVFLPSAPHKPQTVSAGLQYMREALRKPHAVIRLIGLSGVGKTRFVQGCLKVRQVIIRCRKVRPFMPILAMA